jgi:hypothetical protein
MTDHENEGLPHVDEEELARFIEETRQAVEDPAAGEYTLQSAFLQAAEHYQRYAPHHERAAKATETTAERLRRAIEGSSPAGAVLALERAYKRAVEVHEQKRDLSERLLDLFEDVRDRFREAVGEERWAEVTGQSWPPSDRSDSQADIDRMRREAAEYGYPPGESREEEEEERGFVPWLKGLFHSS